MKPVDYTILHTESHLQWGGQERRVFNECRWMKQRGCRVVLALPPESVLYQKAGEEGWDVFPVSFRKSGMVGDLIRLRRIFKEISPHVLNTHGNTDTKVALMAAKNMKIPCVIRTRHSTPAVRNNFYNRFLYEKSCHLVFTTANCITSQIRRDFSIPEDRVVTMASGMQLPDKLPDPENSRQELGRELGLGFNDRFIGCVGRLSEEKGHDTLIEAFFRVMDQLPRHHLVIVGEGGFRKELERLISEKGLGDSVHLIGYRDNPWPYYRAFDCTVLASSRFEGTPQVLMEAMYARCPVVGTQIGGIPDIVTHRETGLLVPPDNPDRLGSAIVETIQETIQARMRVEKAQHFVLEYYTMDALGERILAEYERCIQKTR